MIWSCLRANWKKRAGTRRHTRPPGRVTSEPFFPPTRPLDNTRPFTLPHHSTPWSSITSPHHHHHSTGHSITSSQSTQIRTQPDKLSTRKRRGEDKVFRSGLDLHRITKPISAHYLSMGRVIRLLACLPSFYFVLY